MPNFKALSFCGMPLPWQAHQYVGFAMKEEAVVTQLDFLISAPDAHMLYIRV